MFNFRQLSCYVLETTQDTATFTVEGEQKS